MVFAIPLDRCYGDDDDDVNSENEYDDDHGMHYWCDICFPIKEHSLM